MKTRYSDVAAFVTKDGSIIRELVHPNVHGNAGQSFAEAIVAPGQTTQLHCHRRSEEVYHITAGQGRMTLGHDVFEVTVGDTVLIPPGTPHRIENTGRDELKILCACAPPYADADTDLLVP